jgi:hypothetical protein
MIIGIILGVEGAIYPQISCVEWTYIPSLLAWTLPAIYKRVVYGKMVIKDPNVKLKDLGIKIRVKNFDNNKRWIHIRVAITALVSIVSPWLTVLLAYFVPPVGFFCRSIYLSVICSIWSLNNIIAYFHHLRFHHLFLEKEKYNIVDKRIRRWYSYCGLVVTVLFLFLAILNNDQKLWVKLGDSCDISTVCPF